MRNKTVVLLIIFFTVFIIILGLSHYKISSKIKADTTNYNKLFLLFYEKDIRTAHRYEFRTIKTVDNAPPPDDPNFSRASTIENKTSQDNSNIGFITTYPGLRTNEEKTIHANQVIATEKYDLAWKQHDKLVNLTKIILRYSLDQNYNGNYYRFPKFNYLSGDSHIQHINPEYLLIFDVEMKLIEQNKPKSSLFFTEQMNLYICNVSNTNLLHQQFIPSPIMFFEISCVINHITKKTDIRVNIKTIENHLLHSVQLKDMRYFLDHSYIEFLNAPT